MFATILLATDGSDCSINAAEKACQLAKAFGGHLHVLYVCTPYPYLNAEERSKFSQEARATADKAFGDIQARFGGPGMTTLFKEGESAADIIVETAADLQTDVIVLGSHGYSGLNYLVLGSVANDVIRKARCPVLVCKPE